MKYRWTSELEVARGGYYLGIVHAQHNTIVIIMPTVKYTDVLCYK